MSMDILNPNLLSAAARSGALDGSLAYAASYTQHRDLIAQTAMSGLQGLSEVLSDTSIYGQTIHGLQQIPERIEAADVEAKKNVFTSTSTAVPYNALRQSQMNQTAALSEPYTWPAREAANTALNRTNNLPTANVTAAQKSTAQETANAAQNVVIANQEFFAGNKSLVDGAYNGAINARNNALNAYNNLPANATQDQRAVALAVYSAANETVNAAQKVLDLKNSLMGQITGTSPTSTDLGGGYTLSTWGNTGITSIVDANGRGILIGADGTVDAMDGVGKGWKFNNPSTFVLPGETKVNVTPGSPASILVTHGLQNFTVSNLRSGQYPSQSSYDSTQGRILDRNSNDGYIIQMNGDAAHWTLGGSVLSDEGSREGVANSFLNNKYKLDPTDVSLDSTPELRDMIPKLGLDDIDYDNDGKLNNEELRVVANALTTLINDLQTAYNAALARIAKANQALEDLNQLLEILRKQADKTAQGRTDDGATAKAELQAIEKRLVAALEALRGSATPTTGDIEGNASNVLQKLTSITHQGGLQPQGPVSVPNNGTPAPSNETPPTGGNVDPLGDSLRRAGRLLSGLVGGASLNLLPLPPAAPASATEGAPATSVPPSVDELAAALTDLIGQLTSALSSTDLEATAVLTQANLSAGLDGLLTALADLGIIDASALTDAGSAQDLLQALAQQLTVPASSSTAASPLTNEQVLQILSDLAQLGADLNVASPQTIQLAELFVKQAHLGSEKAGEQSQEITDKTLTSTATQRDEVAAEALQRAVEHFQKLLDDLAALTQSDAVQIKRDDASRQEISDEAIRTGLRQFLTALSVLGVFSQHAQQTNTSGGVTGPSENHEAINTITGNFYTDPEQQKILEANLRQALQIQSEQLHQATQLFTQSQEIVQKFVSIIQQDDLAKEVVHSDHLSDDQQVQFDQRMEQLRKDLGVEWGSNQDDKSPAGQSNLVSRAVQSGMMV